MMGRRGGDLSAPKEGRLVSSCEHSMNLWLQKNVGNFLTDAISFSRTLLPVVDTAACFLRLYVFGKVKMPFGRYVQS